MYIKDELQSATFCTVPSLFLCLSFLGGRERTITLLYKSWQIINHQIKQWEMKLNDLLDNIYLIEPKVSSTLTINIDLSVEEI